MSEQSDCLSTGRNARKRQARRLAAAEVVASLSLNSATWLAGALNAATESLVEKCAARIVHRARSESASCSSAVEEEADAGRARPPQGELLRACSRC